MWHDGHWHGWEHHFFGWWGLIILIILLVLVVLGVVVAMRWWSKESGPQQPAAAGDAPIDILEKRYARGEIDGDEFRERKRDLED